MKISDEERARLIHAMSADLEPLVLQWRVQGVPWPGLAGFFFAEYLYAARRSGLDLDEIRENIKQLLEISGAK